MNSTKIKLLGVLLILLIVCSEVAPQLLFTKVLAQDSPETFVSRLESYLKDALPPESEPIEEAEYIIPEGFNVSYAERLWRALAPFISLGYSKDEIVNITKNIADGKGVLNFSSLSIEKLRDGSVKLRIPFAGKNFTYYNATNLRLFYKVWNESLVSYYKVRKRAQGVYRYVIEDLNTGKEYTIVSKVFLGAFSSTFYGMEEPTEVVEYFYFPSYAEIGFWGVSKWSGVITPGVPVIAVPGHYEEVKVAVPEQETKFRVLFPAYDPLLILGWVIYTNVSSASINVGETIDVFYKALPININPATNPLNATLRLNVSDAFKSLNGVERKLNNTSTSGAFKLEALKPGTYNITLKVEGNAIFSSPFHFNEVTYTIQISSPPSPSLRVVVKGIDTSLLKHAKLFLELKNEGGSTARNLRLKVTGESVEGVSKEVGDIEVNETKDEEVTLKLLKQWSNVKICATYEDRNGNLYLSEAYTTVCTNNFVVPEHFEEYTAVIPEHEETRRVFVPGYEGYTHIRFYAFSLSERVTIKAGWIIGAGRSNEDYYGGAKLQAVLFPCTPYGYELSVSKELSKEALEKTGVNIVLKKIEPMWEDLGIFEEGNITNLENLKDYELTLVNKTWKASSSVVLNSTEFELYKLRMSSLNDSDDLRWHFSKFTNATRATSNASETGNVVLIYHPIRARGSGPLKSIQVKNYANFNLSYRLEVSQPFESPEFSYFSKPILVKAGGCNTTLASLISSNEHFYVARLFLGSSLVAEVAFGLAPETSPLWQGFWDGIKEKAPGIILSTSIMVVLALPTGGSSLLVEAKSFLASVVVPMLIGASAASNLREVVEAYYAWESMNKVADNLSNLCAKASSLGYKNVSLLISSLENKIRESQQSLAINTGLNLLADVTIRDLFIVLGKENATEYEKGKSFGRVVGSALSLTTYILVYYKFFSEGPKLLSLSGKIKSLFSGFYNWITPPLFDVGVMAGKLTISEISSSLILSEENIRFKDYLEKIGEEELTLTVKLSNDYFYKAIDLSEELKLSEKSFLGLLLAYGDEVGKVSGESWGIFLRNVEFVGSKNSKFADNFLSWMHDIKDSSQLEKAVVELTPKLTNLDDEELSGLGKALESVTEESPDNGFKLFNTYFKMSDNYKNFGEEAVEKISNVFLENVEKDGIKALDAWSKAVEDGGIALRTKVGGVPYPRFWKDLWDALRLKEGDPFTIVLSCEGEECRIPTEAKDMSGDHVLSPLRRGGFDLLQGGEYVEAYPGFRNPSLFMEVKSEEGATYVFAKDNEFERRYIEEHGGQGLQIIMYKKVGSSFEEHYIIRNIDMEEAKTPAIYFKSYGPGIYKIEFVKKLEISDFCNYVEGLKKDIHLTFDEASGKFRLTLFGIPLESIESKYDGNIERTIGGYQIKFPLQTVEKTWALALLFTVDSESGELTSKFNFAYDVENPAWRHVKDLQTLDTDEGKVLQITFELSDYDQTARIRWDEASGKFADYKIKPGKLLESIMGAFLSKDYFSESMFEGTGAKGRIRVNIVKNVREYRTWYEDARHSFNEHAKGVAGCEIGNAILLEKYKNFFGIEGDFLIDKSGQNLKENEVFDVFTVDMSNKKRIQWCSEWKTRFIEDVDIASELNRAKNELLMKRVIDARNKKFELPDYGYAFAMKITESYIEIWWEKVKIPEP
ncbi:MAG: hypothetical protein ACP5KW_07760 [Thermoproteota archaeon]